MRFWISLLFSGLVWGTLLASPARGAALLELKVKDQTYRGRLVARNDDFCWLIDRDGRISQVQLNQVDGHRSLANEFRRYSAADMRDQLRREFGNDLEFSGTSHFVVGAAKGRASTFAPLFEDIYRAYHRYLASRGLRIQEPEFPLVAIVFPDQKAFARYSRKDGVTARPGLMGYYIQTTNRVALFESEPQVRAQAAPTFRTPTDIFAKLQSAHATSPISLSGSALENITWHENIEANLQDTIVHETTHQVAFNTGLHSRIGESPRWVVEGMATVFESPGVRDPHGTTPKQRINRERFVWFGSFAKTRRKPHSLTYFIADDSMFKSSALDAYSQAWALSFFLIETRSAAYSKYLKLMLSREATRDYSAEERLEDFKKAFGNDLDALDAHFLRFIAQLN